jgi:hypothetical protein
MTKTTAHQSARQLRRLGATTTVTGAGDVIASYRGVEVTAQFSDNAGGFALAWRSDTPPDDTPSIRSMAAVRRTLGLPKQPIVIIAGTGRRNSRAHILRPGWTHIAECGVGLDGRGTEGSPREVTCRKCVCIWRQR